MRQVREDVNPLPPLMHDNSGQSRESSVRRGRRWCLFDIPLKGVIYSPGWWSEPTESTVAKCDFSRSLKGKKKKKRGKGGGGGRAKYREYIPHPRSSQAGRQRRIETSPRLAEPRRKLPTVSTIRRREAARGVRSRERGSIAREKNYRADFWYPRLF